MLLLEYSELINLLDECSGCLAVDDRDSLVLSAMAKSINVLWIL